MGAYVNPTGQTKEEWLKENGKQIERPILWEDVPDDHYPVILVDNGLFTAAAIAYSEKELLEFNNPADDRPKCYFIVSREKLLAVSSELLRYEKMRDEK